MIDMIRHIDRYLDNDLDEAETAQLFEWIGADAANAPKLVMSQSFSSSFTLQFSLFIACGQLSVHYPLNSHSKPRTLLLTNSREAANTMLRPSSKS